ncbi:MAG: DNA/RNA non-specific endonuclease [Ruminococcus sp.]|nr:DNA/RNA non-specific endonuclease [Ruminococcus sp.]
MNPSEYIGQSENLRSREIHLQNEISEIREEVSRIEIEISCLESELSILYSELSYAMSMTDEDGNPDYSAVAAIQAEIGAVRGQISQLESELSSERTNLQNAEIQLTIVEAEKMSLLSDINTAADSKNDNIHKASGITGRYSSIGQDLQNKYIQGLNQLQEAAEILGGRISIAAASTSSGTGSRKSYSGGSKAQNIAYVGGVGSRKASMTYPSTPPPQMKSTKPVNSSITTAINSNSGNNISSSPARTMMKVTPSAKQQFTNTAGTITKKSGVTPQNLNIVTPPSKRNQNNIPPDNLNVDTANQMKKISPQEKQAPVRLMNVNKNALARLKKSTICKTSVKNISPSKEKYTDEKVRCLKGGLRYKNINGHRHYLDDNNNVYRIDNILMADTEYTVKGYTYKTDSNGCVISASGLLRTSKTNNSAINGSLSDIGMGYETEGDERGHIIGRQFDAINAIGNVIPQNWKINRTKYRDFENKIAKLVNDKRNVEVNIQIVYPKDSSRPAEIVYNYRVDGEDTLSERFPNEERDD